MSELVTSLGQLEQVVLVEDIRIMGSIKQETAQKSYQERIYAWNT